MLRSPFGTPTVVSFLAMVALSSFLHWPCHAGRPLTLVTAIEDTLDNHLELQIQQQSIEISRAARQQATSAFDRVLSAGATHSRKIVPLTSRRLVDLEGQGIGGGSVVSNTTRSSLSSRKLYRTGMTVTPYLAGERVTGLRLDPATGNVEDQGGSTFSQAGLEVTFPLLRGSGKANVTAQEVSAETDLNAALLERRHLIATLVANTAARYWDYLARLQIQRIRQGAERRGSVIEENVRLLVEADREPASSQYTASANLAQRVAARIEADQESVAANQSLAVAIGAPLESIGTRYSPTDLLPSPVGAESPTRLFRPIDSIISESLERRFDHRAMLARVQSARVVSAASLNLLRPRLDLSVGVGYSGLSDGKSIWRALRAPLSNIRGADLVGGVQYEFPRANNFARSEVLEAQARETRRELEARDLSRRIGSEIVVAVRSLENAFLRVGKARGAVAAYTRALDAEREKLGLGTGSVVDLLTVEDRLTEALQLTIDAQLAYSVALVDLRFATGTLIPAEGLEFTLGFWDPTTIPVELLEVADE